MDIVNRILDILAKFFGTQGLRWVYITIAIIVLLVVIYKAYQFYQNKKRKPVAPAPTTETPAAEPPPAKPKDVSSRLLEKACEELLKKLRTHVVGRNLRAQVAGRSYLYQIPWLMMIGESDSGKSTLLAHTQLSLPLGKPKPSEHGCDAWLFDKGIVLDIKGKYVLQSETVTADDKGWLTLLRLLRQHRPSCPLDSVILTISCQDLLEPQQHSSGHSEQLVKKADHLYHKLWQAQKELGIRFPVFILVTKCDLLHGFSSFSAALPEQLRHNILGWSNPYNIDTVYESRFIEEAFQKIYQGINELQIELVTLATADAIAQKDDFLLFPHQFRVVFKQLKIYLDSLFQPSVYHEPFFLRGIYFCGDMSEETSTGAYQATASSDKINFEPQWEKITTPKQPIFLAHLFRDKLFREIDLARPVLEALYRQKQILRRQQAIVAAAAVGIGLGQWWDFNQLKRSKATVLPVLEQLSQDLNAVREAKTNASLHGEGIGEVHRLQFEGAEHLLAGMSKIQNESFFSLFLPASWISSVNNNIVKALALGYDQFFLKWIYQKLFDKADNLLFQYNITEEVVVANQKYRRDYIVNTTEFRLFRSFVTDFIKLQANVDFYNGLKTTDFSQLSEEEMKKISSLVQYLGGNLKFNLDTWRFYGKILASIRSDVRFTQFDLANYLPKIHNKITDLANQWFSRIFTQNQVYLEIASLVKELEKIEVTADLDQWVASLFNTVKLIGEVEKYLGRNSEWNWIAHSELEFTEPHFTKLLLDIDNTPSLKYLQNELQRLGDKYYQLFRKDLFNLRNRLTKGAVLIILSEAIPAAPPASTPTPESPDKESNEVKPTEADLLVPTQRTYLALAPILLKLKQSVERLKQEGFMTPVESTAPITQLPEEIESLNKAIALTQSFKQYLENELPKVEEPQLQRWLRKAAEIRLYQNTNHFIAQAQPQQNQIFFTSKPELQGEIQHEQKVRADTQNFFNIIALLEQIFEVFKNFEHINTIGEPTHHKIHQLVLNRAYELLQQVDHLLESDLYVPDDSTFKTWDGTQSPLQIAFAVRDPEETEYYLSLERNRIKYLIENYIKALMTLLGKQANRWSTSDILLKKWDRIQLELDKYDAKKEANSLRELEQFILFKLDKISLDNCPELTYYGQISGDYFLEKLHQIQDAIFKRCQTLADEQIYSRYVAIAEAFDRKLAKRFPFAPLTTAKFFDEVTPESIQSFFEVYDTYNQELIKLLNQSDIFVASREKILSFLHQLDEVKLFFSSLLTATLPLDKPLYDVIIDFRVNQAYEKGANQIIDWQFTIADNRLNYPYNNNEQGYQVRWQLWEPIQISLRWARNSSFRPYLPDEMLKALDAKWTMSLTNEGDQVIFQYRSMWALLELLQRQRQQISTADFVHGREEKPYLIKLIIPVKNLLPSRPLPPPEQPPAKPKSGDWKSKLLWWRKRPTPELEQSPTLSESKPQQLPYQDKYRAHFEKKTEAVVFMRLILMHPDKKEQVRLPNFPYQAPTLDNIPKHLQQTRRLLPLSPRSPSQPQSPPPAQEPPPAEPPQPEPPKSEPPPAKAKDAEPKNK
jgi:type VI secretion system protein ImpL